MKLGTVKTEALKLMFINYAKEIDAEDIPDLMADDNYSSYLVNMDGAIRRGIDRIVNAGKLPTKSVVLENGEQVGSMHYRFDLTKIPDFSSVVRVTGEEWGEYKANFPFQSESYGVVLVRTNDSQAVFRMIYRPKAPDITGLENIDELPIPNELANILPYFIKADLYEEDEPQLSSSARNQFEQYLAAIDTKDKSIQTHVKAVYSI